MPAEKKGGKKGKVNPTGIIESRSLLHQKRAAAVATKKKIKSPSPSE